MHGWDESVAEELVAGLLADSADVKLRSSNRAATGLAKAARVIAEAFDDGFKLMTCGNGGSAADAQHLAAEFVGRFRNDRHALPAVALTTDTSALTAIGNDYGFEEIFQRQVQALGRAGDVLLCISTSGRSRNAVLAASEAKSKDITVVAFLGGPRNDLHDIADIAVVVPSTETARIQEAHLTFLHILCELVEFKLGLNLTDRDSRMGTRKVARLEELVEMRGEWRKLGLTVGTTNGCFDVLHAGHIQLFQEMRRESDVVVVGVNEDATVTRLKGESRPVNRLSSRLAVLEAISLIDFLFTFAEDTPTKPLTALEPELHFKGAEYADTRLPEADAVEAAGGETRFVPRIEEISTSQILSRTALDSANSRRA